MNKHSKFRGLMDCIENSISSHGLTITELYQVMLETLSGVEKEHNQAISELENELQTENQALRNELAKYKKQVASDDKYLDKASFIEIERDQLRNELEALKVDQSRLNAEAISSYLEYLEYCKKVSIDVPTDPLEYITGLNKLEQDND